MLGNGEPGVEVEAAAGKANWVKRASEASGLTLAGFRDLFGGAGLAEARMSAACIVLGRTICRLPGNIWQAPDRIIQGRLKSMIFLWKWRGTRAVRGFKLRFTSLYNAGFLLIQSVTSLRSHLIL